MLRPRTLRVRLALAFGLTTTVVAVGLGTLILHQARRQLGRAIDEGLVPVAADVARRVQLDGPQAVALALPELAPPSDAFAQVLDPADGRVMATSTFPGQARPLLSARQTQRVDRENRRFRLETTIPNRPEAGDGRRRQAVRLVAVPLQADGRHVVFVAGTSFDEPLHLEERLEFALRFGLPVLAAAVALGGWLLTGAMFRPVRSMIEQADTISAGQPGGRLSISDGGAELIALAARLNAMLDRIDAAAARERAFLDDASHELRTPISIVRGELELVRQVAADDAQRSALDSVLDEVERLERLAHNLLVMARSRGGSLTGGESPVDLETVVARAARAVTRRARNRQVRLCCTGNGVVNGDESALERAVLNLLDNAVRYARKLVTVSVEENADAVEVTVVDDGPGFDEALLPHAFDRYVRDPGTGGGMGLGLAIAVAIIAAHGGTVAAANLPGRGAEVRLTLPVA